MKTYRESGGIAPPILYLGLILLWSYHYDKVPIGGLGFVGDLLLLFPHISDYLQHPEAGSPILSRRMRHALIKEDQLNMVCWLTVNEILSTKNLN
jgi:hypothetical protein